ncbi:hypothetical protein [Streptomyces sparsogenes]|uniref:hypothetical protein n=1 Tax=Streptomyces sparsogenes TaxID=67365 RepID=UPI003F4CF99D
MGAVGIVVALATARALLPAAPAVEGPGSAHQTGTSPAADRTRRPETSADHPRQCEMAAGNHRPFVRHGP